jgi:hypothetical protein
VAESFFLVSSTSVTAVPDPQESRLEFNNKKRVEKLEVVKFMQISNCKDGDSGGRSNGMKLTSFCMCARDLAGGLGGVVVFGGFGGTENSLILEVGDDFQMILIFVLYPYFKLIINYN